MHMARSAAKTVEEFLEALPEERRPMLAELRKLIRKHLPKGYTESVGYGMLMYAIPLATFPDTYNGQPLCYIALASHKHYCSLYLMGAYGDPAQVETLRAAFAKAGKKMDMGKSCLRFKSLDDLPLPAIAKLIAEIPPKKFIAMHDAVHGKNARPFKACGVRRRQSPL
jgi:Domain of unknown function (DU1801).